MTPSWVQALARPVGRVVCVTVALVVVLAVAYQGFLGWDTEYDVDPVTGAQSGPYQSWQVVGLGVAAVIAVALATWFGEPVTAWLVSVGVLSWLWARDASATDDSGLWGVGLMLLVPGLLIGLGAVVAITTAARSMERAADPFV